MHYVLRFLGILLLLVALAGMVASCTGIGFVWNSRDTWRAEAVTQLGAIEDGLALVTDVAGKARIVMQKARDKVDDLDRMVKLVGDELQKKGAIETMIVPGLERDLKEWCEQAKDWVHSLEQGAESARSALVLFSSLPLTTQDESARERSAGLRVAAKQLDEIMNILKNLSTWLGQLRNRVDLEKNVARLAGLVNDINGRLNSAQSELNHFDGKIQSWKNTAGKLKDDVPHLFELGTWGVTAFLAWFAVGQIALLILGWKLTLTPAAA